MSSAPSWQAARLEALSLAQVYAVLALRESVFVVEQRCAYQELDGRDLTAHHLMAWVDELPVAYLRVLPPAMDGQACAIGRVLTAPVWRGQGLGHALMRRGLALANQLWPGAGVVLSAQAHLQDFYRHHGFETVSAPYDEDGIAHVAMRLREFPDLVGQAATAGAAGNDRHRVN